MTVLTRISRAPGVRRLIRKRQLPPGAERESPDGDDDDPTWCAECGRQALFDEPQCASCGAPMLTAAQLAVRRGTALPPAGHGPTHWRLPEPPP